MHSSALECIAWERGSTGDPETGDSETGDTKTSEREREKERSALLVPLCHVIFLLPYLVLVRSRYFDKQRTKSKLHKLMINHLF